MKSSYAGTVMTEHSSLQDENHLIIIMIILIIIIVFMMIMNDETDTYCDGI